MCGYSKIFYMRSYMQLHWALNMMDVLDHSGFHAKHAGVLVQFWMGNEGDEV